MLTIIRQWYDRNLTSPAAVNLMFILLLSAVILMYFGYLFTPLIVSVIIAYLLDGIVARLEKWHIPSLLSVISLSNAREYR